MENEYKQSSKFQRDWQSHYPVILIYLTLVIACVVVGKETNWQFFGFLMYALLAVGILYLLCFLPWYFISLKENSLSSGFKTSTRGISLILGLTCAFLLMFKTWGDWNLGTDSPIIAPIVGPTVDVEGKTVIDDDEEIIIDHPVRVSSKKKYHELGCRFAHDGMEMMSLDQAERKGIVPGKCCH